jgi:hypothetical protein
MLDIDQSARMSDKEIPGGDKKGSGWTDRERVSILLHLVDRKPHVNLTSSSILSLW